MTVIYGLVDDSGRVRYVGRTGRRLELRLAEHERAARANAHTRCARWLRSLDRAPQSVVLEVVGDDGAEAECRWIAHFRAVDESLTNLTPGGDGITEWTDEMRQQMRAKKLGQRHPVSLEALRRSVAERAGKPMPDAQRAAITRSWENRPRAERCGRSHAPDWYVQPNGHRSCRECKRERRRSLRLQGSQR